MVELELRSSQVWTGNHVRNLLIQAVIPVIQISSGKNVRHVCFTHLSYFMHVGSPGGERFKPSGEPTVLDWPSFSVGRHRGNQLSVSNLFKKHLSYINISENRKNYR